MSAPADVPELEPRLFGAFGRKPRRRRGEGEEEKYYIF